MKKVAVVCNYNLNPLRIGGMDRFYTTYDRMLKAAGYQVDWYFNRSESFEFYGELTICSANSQGAEAYFLSALIKDGKQYDILVTHFLALCTDFYKKAKQLHIGYIIAVDHNPRPIQGFPFSKRLKNKIKGILYSRYIDRFIGVSDYTSKSIIKDFGSFLKHKTATVYNGIDTTVFRKRDLPNINRFIVCSHLRPSKGIQDLIQALSEMNPELLNGIQIDIYGEGPYERELMEMAKKNNLNSIISFKGSSPALNQIYAEYSYMIQPTYMECFSLSILESLAANVPVITTTVGGNPEIIKHGENGYLFEVGDINTLKQILEGVITGQFKIITEVNTLIETRFNLAQMVQNHFKLLP